MIKNIIFDFGNVLLEWNEAKIAKKYSEDEKQQEILKNIIFKSSEWLKLDNGSMDYQEVTPIFKEKLPENLKCKVEKIMNTWYKTMPINKEIIDLIKVLKEKNYKVYALSNTHIPVYEYVKGSEIGKYFDGFLISAIEKMMKPDQEIYYRLFEKFNLIPGECFFIDDSEKNIIASRNCGMDGHIFDINNYRELVDILKEKNII